MRTRAKTRVRVGAAASAALVAFSGLSVVLSANAGAVPSRDINQVRAQVRALQMRAESATERYNSARSDLQDIQGKLAALQARAARERTQLREVLSSVDDLARSTYTSGGIDSSLQVLLADDPSQFLAQAAALDQVAQSQSAAIRRTQTARLRLAQTEAEAADKERIAQGYRDDMAEAKQEADQQLADAQDVLNSLEAAERQRLAALEAEDRQQAQAAAAAAAANFDTGPSASGGGYTGGGRAAAVVSYALSQVGDRYVAAAAGPDSFDCSGLTLSAWRQAGVSLPHYSVSQYGSTQHVSVNEAQPGDLVFYFGGGAHHVGLYIGGGKMVHAANPSDGVRIDSIFGPWYNERFSGIGRVVG